MRILNIGSVNQRKMRVSLSWLN